jgi:hypothetical protein
VNLKSMNFEIKSFILILILYPSFLQGLILSNALRAQKNAEDESCTIALGNLRSEVIKLRNEALEKDKILLSLVDKGKKMKQSLTLNSKLIKPKLKTFGKNLPKPMRN